VTDETIEVLLVRGAPGVGKSAVVSELKQHIPDGAVIEVDTIRQMLARPRNTDRAQHVAALELAWVLARAFLAQGVCPVVVVDTFTSRKLSAFVASVDRPYRIVSLYAEPEALRIRLLQRGISQRDQLESAAMHNTEIASQRYPNEKCIDTTSRDPQSVALSALRWLLRRSGQSEIPMP
jgi:predicted kinase